MCKRPSRPHLSVSGLGAVSKTNNPTFTSTSCSTPLFMKAGVFSALLRVWSLGNRLEHFCLQTRLDVTDEFVSLVPRPKTHLASLFLSGIHPLLSIWLSSKAFLPISGSSILSLLPLTASLPSAKSSLMSGF